MKKLLPITLISIMLVACGGEQAETSKNTENKASVAEAKPVDACKTLESAIRSSISDASDLKQAEDPMAKFVGDDLKKHLPKECSYRFASQGAEFDAYAELWKVNSKYADEKAFKNKVKFLNVKKTEAINNIGEQAVYTPESNNMVALNNRSIIQVRIRCVGNPQCAKAKPIIITLTKSILKALDK